MASILLLSAGRRVGLLQSIISSARQLLPDVCSVLAADAFPELSSACSFADRSFKLPRVIDPGYVQALLELCQLQNVRLVIPTIDPELLVLARERKRFEELGVDLLVSDSQLISRCRDKRLTSTLFADIGIPSPVLLDPQSLQFPCFVKPVSGSCSQGVRCIPSPFHVTRAELEDPSNLFQELVPTNWQEYTCDCWYGRDSRLISLVPRERLETRGGEISKGITRRGAVMNLLRPALEQITNARGCLTVQVFLSPEHDRLIGVEINPRFGGGYPLSHAAGAAFPELMIREWLLEELPCWQDDWQSDLMMLRYDAMVLKPLG